MIALFDKVLDAYAKWPPVNQLLFASLALALGLVFVFLLGLWLTAAGRNLTVALRGWPDKNPLADLAELNRLLGEYREWHAGKRRQEKSAIAEINETLQKISSAALATPLKEACTFDLRRVQREQLEETEFQAELDTLGGSDRKT